MISLLYTALFAGLIPVAVLLILNIKSKKAGPIIPFLYLTAISSLYEMLFTLYLKIDSTLWFTVYDILAFSAMFYFFYKINYPKYRILFITGILLFTVLIIPNIFSINKSVHHFLNVQSLFSGAITAFIFVMTFLWFIDIFKKMETPNLWSVPDFYYVSALFIYYSSTFFLFLLSDVILSNDSGKLMDYWLLNIIATLVLRILLITGVWKTSRK